MAAVIELTTITAPAVRPSRPDLRLVQGGRAPEVLLLRRTYLRRRLLVAVVALAVVLLAARAVVGVAAAQAAPAGAGVDHVVHAGDTMWSIAADVAPDVDRRVAVDRLVDANGGSSELQVGQVVRVPGTLLSGS